MTAIAPIATAAIMPTAAPQSAAPTNPAYLLIDRFEDLDDPAPIASPRACAPGPGQVLITDSLSAVSLLGGRIVEAPHAAATIAVNSSIAFARQNGRALMLHVAGVAAGFQKVVGWSTAAAFSAGTSLGIFVNGLALACRDGATSATASWPVTAGDYDLAVILGRAGGGFYLARGPSFPNWTLLYPAAVSPSGAGACYGGWGQGAATTIQQRYDDLLIVDLGAPWIDDYGIATQRLAGPRAAGDTLAHTPDGHIEWTETTRPTAGTTDFQFRRVDASNYWQVTISSTGALTLNEVVAGVPTQRGTAAGVVASGNRIVVSFIGATIKVIQALTGRISYTAATSFQTAVAARLNALGTGEAIADLVSWPAYPDITLPLTGVSVAPVGAWQVGSMKNIGSIFRRSRPPNSDGMGKPGPGSWEHRVAGQHYQHLATRNFSQPTPIGRALEPSMISVEFGYFPAGTDLLDQDLLRDETPGGQTRGNVYRVLGAITANDAIPVAEAAYSYVELRQLPQVPKDLPPMS